VQFLVTSISFLLVAAAFALRMRVQLALPEHTVVGLEVYNRLFTMHGTIMMYLFAVPFHSQSGGKAVVTPCPGRHNRPGHGAGLRLFYPRRGSRRV
jgi:heme/copper-type cytochrome/quinol oxidase subunit 1